MLGGGGERVRVTEIKRMRDRKDAANSTGCSSIVQNRIYSISQSLCYKHNKKVIKTLIIGVAELLNNVFF